MIAVRCIGLPISEAYGVADYYSKYQAGAK